jgi:lipoate-protein ligase A
MGYPSAEWRLITSPPGSGAWNMAVDDVLLNAVSVGQSLPILRLYAWDPPCLSLGYAQPSSDVDLKALEQQRWDIVRRPTGGRAILHTDELTYAVIAPERDPIVAGGVLESYRRLSTALLAALHKLNAPAATEERVSGSVQDQGPVCFEVPSSYEITVNGMKLIGSAQVRRRGGVLQHGSLPIEGDLTRITRTLSVPDEITEAEATNRLKQRATTLEDALGRIIPWDKVARAFRSAFRGELNLTFRDSALNPQERAEAQKLVETRYGNEEWTFRV